MNRTGLGLAALVTLFVSLADGSPSLAQSSTSATLTVDLAKPGPAIPPSFYGLMTEEINHSYDGGLYAELIQNRSFQDDPVTPAHWSLVQDGGGSGSIALDAAQPLSGALPDSLKLTVATPGGRVGAANDGYWGVPVMPVTRYQASFYARASAGFAGPLTLDLESADGQIVYAQARIGKVTGDWERYTATLTTGKVAPTEAARFVVSASTPGSVNLCLVSLFPPTYKSRPDGFRPDLMQKMAALKPAFLRLPGGNYLEGSTIATRFDWKRTVGPWAQRPGHPGPWGYRSSDGLGLLEFLDWCEDLHMQPLLAVYAGYSLGGEHVDAGPALQPYVQDALDEIEYVTGGTDTKWGAERAKDGHPAPFPLEYIEVGNEDGFDKSGSYDGRFAQFFDAIKAKYPKLQVIATTKVTLRRPDVTDEHYYQSAAQMEHDAHRFDTYDRTGPKVFVGEWAAFDTVAPWQQGAMAGGPTPNLNCALGDAAWLTGLERNADMVVMESYAPMLVNVNPGARQWTINLIGFDALTSYGSPSYYVQTMFGQHHGDVVVPATLTGDRLFESVTRDTKTGRLDVKLVNTADTAQPVHLTLRGAESVAATGTAFTLSGADPADTNTLSDPTKIVPVVSLVSGVSSDFTYTVTPYSVTVLEMRAK